MPIETCNDPLPPEVVLEIGRRIAKKIGRTKVQFRLIRNPKTGETTLQIPCPAAVELDCLQDWRTWDVSMDGANVDEALEKACWIYNRLAQNWGITTATVCYLQFPLTVQ